MGQSHLSNNVRLAGRTFDVLRATAANCCASILCRRRTQLAYNQGMTARWDVSIALASLVACACDAGTASERSSSPPCCTPRDIGPDVQLSHRERSTRLDGTYLLRAHQALPR